MLTLSQYKKHQLGADKGGCRVWIVLVMGSRSLYAPFPDRDGHNAHPLAGQSGCSRAMLSPTLLIQGSISWYRGSGWSVWPPSFLSLPPPVWLGSNLRMELLTNHLGTHGEPSSGSQFCGSGSFHRPQTQRTLGLVLLPFPGSVN